MTESSLNGDLTRRVVVDTQQMDWSPSPSGTVWRKRLHRVGPPEAGQVTSLVRYEPGSDFHSHEHPDGEEIFVLEGVFSDEHGDWPAGTYLLNPEGVAHAPSSEDGCLLFVKLRQAPGRERRQTRVFSGELEWSPGPEPGIEVKALYEQEGFADRSRLERWQPGTTLSRSWPEGVEIFVIEGRLADDEGAYGAGTWLRLPAGSRQVTSSPEGCELLVKEGGLRYLLSD